MAQNLHNRFISLCIIAALLLNGFLAFAATYQLPSNPQISNLSSLFGDKLLICTSTSFKWVSIADIESGKEAPKPHPQMKCPACYLASNVKDTLTLLAMDYLYQPLLTDVPFRYSSLDDLRSWLLSFHYAIRGPPISNLA